MSDALFDISRAIHVRRTEMMLMTRDLAERSGIEIETMRHIVNKGTRDPVLLTKIASVFGCHVSELDPEIKQPVAEDSAAPRYSDKVEDEQLVELLGRIDRFGNVLQPRLGYKPGRRETIEYLLGHSERDLSPPAPAADPNAAFQMAGLDMRSRNILLQLSTTPGGPKTPAEVALYGEGRLLKDPVVGHGSIAAIREALRAIDLDLSP